ncbi:MAG TPA: trypsin-like serine protease [Bdellovibrionales bacterium]|nr:trypsin-like serine protease [Bdellovibrionales bacterium]
MNLSRLFGALLISAVSILGLNACSSNSVRIEPSRKPANDGAVLQPDSPIYKLSVRISVDDRQWCSGFLIDKNKILTAAHCFREFLPLKVVNGRFRFLVGGEVVQSIFRVYANRTFDFDEDRTRANSGDLAVIVLDTPVARESFFPVIDPSIPLDATVDSFFSIGFGPNPKELKPSESAGIARQTQMKIKDLADSDRITAQTGVIGEGTICGGDSGSPLLVQRENTWLIVGVASGTVFANNKSTEKPDPEKPICQDPAGEALFTKPQAFFDFVKEPEKHGKPILAGE